MEPLKPFASANILFLKEQQQKNTTNEKRRPALVFDIDQTAFLYHIDVCKKENPENCKRRDFESARRNEEIYSIYKYAVDHGITIFFITARVDSPSAREKTEFDLRRLGYDKYKALYLRPPLEIYNSRKGIALFKSSTRKFITEKMGYHILKNYGDKWQDIAGGYAQSHVKLPDVPRYVVSSSQFENLPSSDSSLFD